MVLKEEVKIRCWGGDGYRSEFISKAGPAILGHNPGHASVEIIVKKGKAEDKILELKKFGVYVSEITEVQNPISSYEELLKLTEEYHKNGVMYFENQLIDIISKNRDRGIPIEEIMQKFKKRNPSIYEQLMTDRSFNRIYFSFWPDSDNENHYLSNLHEDYWDVRAASPISESDFMNPLIDQSITEEEKRKQFRTQRAGIVTNKVALSTIGKKLSEEQKNIEIKGRKLKDIVNELVKCYRDIDSLEGDIIRNEKELKKQLTINGTLIPKDLAKLVSKYNLFNELGNLTTKYNNAILDTVTFKKELREWKQKHRIGSGDFRILYKSVRGIDNLSELLTLCSNNSDKVNEFVDHISKVQKKLKELKSAVEDNKKLIEDKTALLEEQGYEDLACIGKEPDATIELPLRNDDTPGLDFEKMLDAMKDVVTDGKKFNLYEKNCSSTSAKIISAGLEGDPRFDSIKSRLDNLMEDNDYVRNIPDSVIAKLIKRFDPEEDYKTGTFSPAYIRKEANKIKQQIERPGEFHIEFIEDLIDILRDLAKLIHDLIQIKTGNDWVSRYENSEVIREPGKTSMVSEQTSRSTKAEKDKPMDAKNLPPNLPPEIV